MLYSKEKINDGIYNDLVNEMNSLLCKITTLKKC